MACLLVRRFPVFLLLRHSFVTRKADSPKDLLSVLPAQCRVNVSYAAQLHYQTDSTAHSRNLNCYWPSLSLTLCLPMLGRVPQPSWKGNGTCRALHLSSCSSYLRVSWQPAPSY